MHEQVERVRGKPRERGMRPKPVGVQRGPVSLNGLTTPAEGLHAFDEVERKLDEVETEIVAHDRSPVRWAWPAFQRETGVDPQVHFHPRPPVCKVAEATTSRYRS